MRLNKRDIVEWLTTKDKRKLNKLWNTANAVREKYVGDEVHFRGIIEISNYCVRHCLYCGIRGERRDIHRYHMTDRAIKSCIRKIEKFGYGTVVIQAGESPRIIPNDISELVRWIKQNTSLAITLSLGEQPYEVLKEWKGQGADRYLLKIETTDKKLLEKIHPGEPFGSRKENISRLKQLGYEVGSGIMIGIPGQTYTSVAKDILWFKRMDIDMIGIGPFIPHPDTPLATYRFAPRNQIPGDELTVNKAIALTRIKCKEANMPATTALASINLASGRENALFHGANVVMPNVTPIKYRKYYEIYPSKACIRETADLCSTCMTNRMKRVGRKIGTGVGARQHSTKRQ
ncbi:[FeFe] hydrogenase H-cluster radical SAM maturase HydE [bacterium]|nr:[FeFe] hydrogenase H-cluster radical SAM maturase HydE [bacterium]